VGSAIVRCLKLEGHTNLLLATRRELDLRYQSAVSDWFAENRPEYVYLVAGTVGGIHENDTRPADFIYDNLLIHCTVVEAARQQDAKKLLYLGSSCVYPREAPQPMREEYLLSGPLEPTNEAYAVAKIAGIKLCAAYKRQYGCNFISAMPTNLYGPGDNFDLQSSHVAPALMRKLHEAKLRGEKELVVWGSGTPRREFMHVDDLADCCLHLMRHYDEVDLINVGTGEEVTIRGLAELLGEIIHPEAEIVFDASKPDGTPRKLLDVSGLRQLGWRHRTELRQGLESTYAWFEKHYEEIVSGGRDRRSLAP
jgi:GDP-L-fucose synthase